MAAATTEQCPNIHVAIQPADTIANCSDNGRLLAAKFQYGWELACSLKYAQAHLPQN